MNTILFDLDGTLLPMEMDTFTKCYFTALAKKCVPITALTEIVFLHPNLSQSNIRKNRKIPNSIHLPDIK